MSTLLSRSFANAIRLNAFLYTVHKEEMTGIGCIYVDRLEYDADYAGLSEEFRQPVIKAMMGVSPFVGSMNPFVEAFNMRRSFVTISEQSPQAS